MMKYTGNEAAGLVASGLVFVAAIALIVFGVWHAVFAAAAMLIVFAGIIQAAKARRHRSG